MNTVTRYKDISCGHRITGHPGKCANLHGHNYRIFMTFSGRINEDGMVVDFGDIKLYFDHWLEQNWDHRFLIWEKDPDYDELKRIDNTVLGVPFNPTAELMARYLFDNFEFDMQCLIEDEGYNNKLELIEVKVQETEKCWAVAY